MLRLRRSAAALTGALLLTSGLAACGGGGDSDSSAAGIDGVTLTGDVGKAVNAKWSDDDIKATKATTLVKGKGDKVASDDTVSSYVWLGNPKTKKSVYSDYQNGAPEAIPAGQVTGVLGSLFKNATYGSRVAAVTTGSKLFGSSAGNSQLGISGSDPVVLVVDLVKKQEESPTPSDDKVHDVPQSAMPKIVEKAGKPTGLDFTGIAEPALTTPVQRTILKQGTGAAIKASDTITINYLGATYKATSPFDESYSKGQPLTSALSGLVKGWQIGLPGVKVGSRVLLQMPPAYGYGAQGSGSTIPGNATLWFVIDVVGTKAS